MVLSDLVSTLLLILAVGTLFLFIIQIIFPAVGPFKQWVMFAISFCFFIQYFSFIAMFRFLFCLGILLLGVICLFHSDIQTVLDSIHKVLRGNVDEEKTTKEES